MNNKTIEIQEDDLHAYVDNQLSVEKVEAVEALMRKDPKVMQQVHEWQQQNEAITALFSNDESLPTSEKLKLKNIIKQTSVDTPNTHKTPWFYSVAASVFLLVMGGALGWFAHGLSQPLTKNTANFVNSAISAHQVYSVEVLHPVEVNADKQKHLVAWLSKRINHSLAVPNLQEYGYDFLGGRLLAMRKGKAAAQLMFENNEGKRVTLLVSKNKNYRDQAFHLKNIDNINTYYWMDSKVAYSITGEMNSRELRKLSTSVYQQLNEKLASL
ncbi:MAG TPA: anti-sigma factor [Leucothrix mucor]|nr:anti-sigma factor [Leucothrix mucor]